MKVVVNPKYEFLKGWIEEIPHLFSLKEDDGQPQDTPQMRGEIIYNARNQIRRFQVERFNICVKRFHQPRFFNRIIYTYLRASKARRSYENGLFLMQHQIGTPEPIAYIEDKKGGLLGFSYLITLQSSLTRLNREFTLNYTPELDQTIRPLARFTAHMHDEGVLHLDYSPGNILWDKIDGQYLFEVIDINRMRVGQPVSLKEGAKSMRRLCATTSFFRIFAEEYAIARGMDVEECTHKILYYRDRFWHHGKKAKYQYD